ncbi:MAG: DNA-processing protein DprA [Clostridia bacterium]|nr:DNA-processing protein DprA [Clostridia bacterium]
MDNLTLWVWLSEKCAPDTPYFSILYHTFGSVERIYAANQEELEGVFGLKSAQIKALCDKNTAKAEAVIRKCRMENIGIIPYNDDLFPSRLRVIKNPPVLLYYKGRLPIFEKEVCIGTVGTRTPSSYGCRCAYEIAFDLALSGAYVISGMASGIDSICHTAALDAGGKTVAVLGCGINVIYPKENTELYNRLANYGTIISEYPPDFSATRYTFPQRNRIISGLSLGTLIVEAQLKSGAMITAKIAIEQNRDLFAIPGRLGEYNSIGPNSLLQMGAKAVSSAYDILNEYEFLYPDKIHLKTNNGSKKNNPYKNTIEIIKKTERPKNTVLPVPEDTETPQKQAVEEEKPNFDHLPEQQKNICVILSKTTPKSLEEIAGETNISVSDIMSSLTILEIQGIVIAVPGGSFVLA